MLFTPQIEAALRHVTATNCKMAFSMEENGELAYTVYPFKVTFRAKSARQANTIKIELGANKSMTVLLEPRHLTLLETTVGPDIIRDALDEPLTPQKFGRLFGLEQVGQAWHGRHQRVEPSIGELVDILLAAAYLGQTA